MPVERRGSGYHDAALSSLSSATAVRAALARGDLPAALSAVPSPAPLQSRRGRGFVHEEEALTQALLYRLRTASPDALAALYGMDEGLERRFLAAAQTCASREALLDFVKTKRYTRARLSRLCAYALLGLSRDFAQAHRAPEYARVLGFRRSAAPLLKAVKRRSAISLVTKAADFDRAHPLFALDVRAQDLWSLGVSTPRSVPPAAISPRPQFWFRKAGSLPCVCSSIPPRFSSRSSSTAPRRNCRRPRPRCKKLYALFQRLDARAPRKLAFPAFLLTLMLVPFLLALLHPAVEAVLMAFPLFGLSCIPRSARSSASWIPARIPAISPRMNPSSARPAPRSPRPSSRMSACRSC